MQYFKQDDFDDFVCSAGKCPESCCKSWQICIDFESLEKYSELEGPFGNRVKNAIDFQQGTFLQYEENCALLNDEGYCDLQLAFGEQMLCDTCRNFPRHEEEYEGVREYSLSLACPEAARMTVCRKHPLEIYESEDDTEEFYEEFDYLLYTKLIDMRMQLLKIISDKSGRIFDKLSVVFEIGKSVQQFIEEGRIAEIDEFINTYETGCKIENLNVNKIPDSFWTDGFRKLYELEVLRDDWRLYTDCAAEYYFTAKTAKERRADMWKQLTDEEENAVSMILASLIYTYACTAVYDELAFSKVAMCIFMVGIILYIYKAEQAEAAEDASLVRCVYKCCREIEHSNENLDALDEYFEEWFHKEVEYA